MCFECVAHTLDDLKDLFHVQYSEDGSSRKVKEVDTYVFFSDFLDKCYGNSFITDMHIYVIIIQAF